MRSDSEQTLRVAKVENKARKHTRDSDSGTGFSSQVREHRQMPKKNRHNGGDSSKLCKTSVTDQTQVQTQTYILHTNYNTQVIHYSYIVIKLPKSQNKGEILWTSGEQERSLLTARHMDPGL